MKKLLLLILFFLVCPRIFSQISWLSSLPHGQVISHSTGKLLLIDFYADWCGPCKMMDRDLWDDDEMDTLVNYFIPVRIDIDYNRSLATKYSVKGIPKVIIALSNGDVVWEMMGYSGKSEYLQVLRSLPVNLNELFELAVALSGKDPDTYLQTGIVLQKTGKNITNPGLKDAFLLLAHEKFRFSEKQTKDLKIQQKAQLYSILVDVTRGSYKKAQKGIEKGTFDQNDPEIADLVHYILAGCYKGLKDDQNYLREKGLIINEDFLTELRE